MPVLIFPCLLLFHACCMWACGRTCTPPTRRLALPICYDSPLPVAVAVCPPGGMPGATCTAACCARCERPMHKLPNCALFSLVVFIHPLGFHPLRSNSPHFVICLDVIYSTFHTLILSAQPSFDLLTSFRPNSLQLLSLPIQSLTNFT